MRKVVAQAALLAVSGIGARTLGRVEAKLQLLEVDWEQFWRVNGGSTQRLWTACGLLEQQQTNLRQFLTTTNPETYFGLLRARQIQVISSEHFLYPELLNQIDDKPILLFVKGSLNRANCLPLAVVGTRQASAYGRVVINHLVPELVQVGAGIVSGLMYGIDILAHQATLAAGGYTVAVLGYGCDCPVAMVYRRLAEQIVAAGGAVISEYAPAVPARSGTFVRRNRIIAGMSKATIVIEAALKSGSHITAQRALDYGRAVGAVPGPITSRYSDGTKWLINQGAVLVGSAADVLNELELTAVAPTTRTVVGGVTFSQPLLQLLAAQPLNTDQLVAKLSQTSSSYSPAELLSLLSQLELAGVIYRVGSQWYRR